MDSPIDSRETPMDYIKLGRTGLDISPLCLGCMTYGVSELGTHPWTLDEARSRPRITSYNVCYTKLLRVGQFDAAAHFGEASAHGVGHGMGFILDRA